MKTVYDCSNSAERPPHRAASFGPKENDLMRGLKKHCAVFGYEFIDDPARADVIVTNDVYPKSVLSLDKPRVKRMDGVYWNVKDKDRNAPLNEAALQSTRIVFISSYSYMSYQMLYGYGLRDRFVSVVLNRVDDSVFFRLPEIRRKRFEWVASASNWNRPEKRFEDLMVFAREIIPDHTLHLIGNCDRDVPSNVTRYGHVTDERVMNEIINEGHGFVNLSYRDPAPKVVCQAVNCKLPVLYANSGGTRELVRRGAGVGIPDMESKEFESETPRLRVEDIRSAYKEYMLSYAAMYDQSQLRRDSYMECLAEYFWSFDSAIRLHKERRCEINYRKS